MNNKIIIGSANFGSEYGVANNKKLASAIAHEILNCAKELGFFGVDTASGYGNAEEIVGDFFRLQKRKSFKVITKIMHKEYKTVQAVKNEVRRSLEKLNIECIDHLLLHSFKTYCEHKDVVLAAIEELIAEGSIRYWGVSVYHPAEVQQMIDDGFSGFTVEFPLNLFDRRFLRGRFLKALKGKKCFLFARSVFLQGLFFLSAKRLKDDFKTIKEKIAKLRALSRSINIPLSNLLLLFVAANPYVDGLIMGIDSKAQLENNAGFINSLNKYQRIKYLLDEFEVKDENILLPYLWQKSQTGTG
jgi:aryl-alcohol dehydrogenase-like predicted oxidoreductase